MKKADSKRLKAALDLYDYAPCGSVSFDKEAMILDINHTLCIWLGYTKDELILKRSLLSLFRIGGQIFFETHFFPLIQLQGFVKEVYFDIVRKDKSIFHGLINVREVPAHDDLPVSYQATILDISDRWHYEAELIKAKKQAEADSKAKADFLATISHEIRTPLNAILGIGNLLHQTSLNENQKEYAKLLLHSSEHLLGLVNNLLDLSKIEAKKIILEQVPFNLADLANLLHQTYLVKSSEKGIHLHTNVDTDVPNYLIGDPLKLKQILTNLIGNAIKFTKKGQVTIAISKLKETTSEVCLKFVVSDTGIGIPKEKLEAIFQEFAQASYDVNVEFGGTGLGLTISKKLLELHDSSLNVSSALNKGSQFSFELWYKKTNRQSVTTESNSIDFKAHKLEDMRVLIVDDNPANIFIAEQYLDQWKIKYTSAESGLEALSILEEESFHLILLDLQMPKMSGYETAKKIRELNLESSPVIVSFSASTKGEVQSALEEAGIDDHLSKPFQPNELFQKLLKHYGVANEVDNREKKIEPKTETHQDEVPLIETPIPDSYNLQRYRKMANNRQEFLKKFITSTLDALVSYQKDYNRAMNARNIQNLSDLIHKSTMSIYYIQADRLTSLLNESRQGLHQKSTTSDLNELIDKCNHEFETILKGLHKDLKN
ncbi:MAG: hypothetical protein CMC15_03010 [Flavobacteriaceae bacterium]|nr:hypothetical protein [Flavobacteriaceae bacterium]MAY52218.1 hypothetical protein [Flavobacteriaceae bacterium]